MLLLKSETSLHFKARKTADLCEAASYKTGNEIIKCPTFSSIHIESAVYGTPEFSEKNVCHFHGQCEGQRDLTQMAKAECDGRNSCIFRGNNHHAGDPCYGKHKSTLVRYKCLAGI